MMIRERVNCYLWLFVQTGCSNRKCGCVKKGSKCGPGCNCQNCQNMPGIAPGMQQPASEQISEIEQEEMIASGQGMVTNIRHQRKSRFQCQRRKMRIMLMIK